MIELRNISYSYSANSAENTAALENINLTIKKGEFIGVAGHTGSGKTTVAQILAGLIKPTSGEILIDGKVISDYKQAAKQLASRVGIVFQYPEHQLFEETVYKDIAFGPKNKGLSEKEIDECVRRSASLAHLNEKLLKKSPFELSGGQKRRVAIAGILAIEPSVLILDEPAAGLDPMGRKKLIDRLKEIREKGTTVILISHSMEELAECADRIVVLCNGQKLCDATAGEVFSDYQALIKSGLEIPEITKIVKLLREGGMDIPSDIFTVEDAFKAISSALGG